ncbi:hypothetical protein R1sor_025116 [Riccia sorocarpa]|uniref:Uncharacterized protein n=1 Tax=Riccia sorocarpa TaxID=122646 RepID=A0ABD3G7P1_9MARC
MADDGLSDPNDAIQVVIQHIEGSTPSDSLLTDSGSAPPNPDSQLVEQVQTGIIADLTTPSAAKLSKKKSTAGTGRKSSPVRTRARTERLRTESKLKPVKEISDIAVGQSQSTDDIAVGTDTNARRSLWGEMASSSDPGGAFVNIISKYTMKFNGKPTPRIPLCRLVPFCRVRNFQSSSVQTEALRKSFETHCYMEHGAGFHVCPFDETGKELILTDEHKSKWDMLWKMESDAFDEECRQIPEYEGLVGKMFATWDGNHRVITWTEVSLSPEKTNKRAWHPRVRCVIICPPVQAYKQIEVAMHNLNASSHATVQYDWIQDAERCLQELSTPLVEYKEMIGDEIYEEFEKSRQKAPANRAWYNKNMTALQHLTYYRSPK